MSMLRQLLAPLVPPLLARFPTARWRKLLAVALVGFALGAEGAAAAVTVRIDNGEQRMRVYVDGGLAYSWPVSTARPGYQTPPGSYRVQRMERMWYSRKYDRSPMPHAIFFHGGYAIHGTDSIRQLGRPASHGCVRLHPGNARTLYSLVSASGGARIVVANGATQRPAPQMLEQPRLRIRRPATRDPYALQPYDPAPEDVSDPYDWFYTPQ